MPVECDRLFRREIKGAVLKLNRSMHDPAFKDPGSAFLFTEDSAKICGILDTLAKNGCREYQFPAKDACSLSSNIFETALRQILKEGMEDGGGSLDKLPENTRKALERIDEYWNKAFEDMSNLLDWFR